MGRGVLDPERGYLNKWQMYRAMEEENIGPCRLPVTDELSRNSLCSMLERYPQVFVKPVDAFGGHLVSTIRSISSNFEWSAEGTPAKRYTAFGPLAADVLTAYASDTCIVQQAAPLLRFDNKPFDIRVLMQRDMDDRWVFAGSLARVGGERSIVSNIAISGGQVWPAESVIAEVLHRRAEDVERVQTQLVEVGECVCALLDSYRDFEEVGIDIGIADRGELWIIEVNTDDAFGGPCHQLFAKLDDQTLFQEIEQRFLARRMSIVSWLLGDVFDNSSGNA